MIHYVFSLLFLFFSGALWCHPYLVPVEVIISSDAADYSSKLSQAFKEPFHLERMSCDSDVFISKEEFLYLIDFKEGDEVTPLELSRACNHIMKKNKFSSISVGLNPSSNGYHLHWKLAGFWTFKALKLHGFMVGKENYRHYYTLEPGERFDEHKHEHAVRGIKDALIEEGYHQASIETRFEKNKKYKTVTVHLSIDRGPRFSVDTVHTVVKQESGDPIPAEIVKFIQNTLDEELKDADYAKKRINETIQSIKCAIMQRGFFPQSIELNEHKDYERSSIDLTFIITLLAKKKLVFKGNRAIADKDLFEQCMLFGESLWVLPSSILKEEVEKLYKDRGYWSARIQDVEQENSLLFIIDEGNVATVKHVEVITREGLSRPDLAKKYFSKLGKMDTGQSVYENAISALIDAYKEDGYIQARVLNRIYQKIPRAEDQFALRIEIDEGNHFTIRSVIVDGIEEDERATIDPWASALSGSFFSTQFLADQRLWLFEYFKKKGKAIESITYALHHNDHEIDITWQVKIAPHVQFGKTIIAASTQLPFPLIMREMRYKEGDSFDKNKLKESMLGLKSLDIFDGVNVYPEQEHDHERIVSLNLCDDDPFEVRTRIGFGLQQVSPRLKFAGITYKIGGTFLAKNPFNYADQFRVEMDFMRAQRTMRFEYIRPWIFDMPVKTIIAGYNNKYQQPGFKKISENLYEVIQQGLITCFKRNFDSITTGFNIGFEYLETAVNDQQCSKQFALDIARAINFDPRLLDRKILFIQAEPTLVIDRLDNKIDPKQGTFTVASLKGMFPIGRTHGETYFIKLLLDHSLFIPIKPVTLALRFRLGHIFHHDFSTIMPSERFYLGGANSIRSYETDLCPPLGLFTNSCGKKQVVPQGGKTLGNCMLEARFPVYKDLSGVVFQDLGMLSDTFKSVFTVDGILAASGFGLRYATPIGPLRFDVGFKWDPRDATRLSYAWFLTFGNAF